MCEQITYWKLPTFRSTQENQLMSVLGKIIILVINYLCYATPFKIFMVSDVHGTKMKWNTFQ